MEQKKVIVIGAGPAGLSAAWTLHKRGIEPIVLEAKSFSGGRAYGDRVGGYCLDTGADFFCDSYDVAQKMCKELEIPLVKSEMNLGWHRNGRWHMTTPPVSFGALLTGVKTLWKIGLLSPRVLKMLFSVFRAGKRQPEFLSFASDSRVAELDDEVTFGEYLDRQRIPKFAQTSLLGFLEMTMGFAEKSGWAYMRTYIWEMFLKNALIYVPEQGAGSFSLALDDKCRNFIRCDSPVNKIEFENDRATGVVVNDQQITADAVICTIPGNRVSSVTPDLPNEIHQALDQVVFSTGVRVVFGLDIPPLPPDWHGALYPEDDTPLLLDRSLNLPACVPAGKSTLDMIVGRHRAAELIDKEDNEIIRTMLEDIYRHPPPGSNIPKFGEWEFARIYRWKDAVCMGRPGMFKNMIEVRKRLSQEYDNFWLAGDYMRIPCVNGALTSGIESANEAADRLEKTPAEQKSS